MTNYALVIWLYQKSGSALETALLSICSYAPYVLMSVFAGALSDRWDKKRTMLCCDLCAAACTLIVLGLFKAGRLLPWHMYILNALSGLMNTVQQPASDVANRYTYSWFPGNCTRRPAVCAPFSQSLGYHSSPRFSQRRCSPSRGMDWVIAVDLGSFAIAFLTLLFCIRVPRPRPKAQMRTNRFLRSARTGLAWLRRQSVDSQADPVFGLHQPGGVRL